MRERLILVSKIQRNRVPFPYYDSSQWRGVDTACPIQSKISPSYSLENGRLILYTGQNICLCYQDTHLYYNPINILVLYICYTFLSILSYYLT